MVRFDDIDVFLNETLRVARVLEIQKAGKILLGMPFTGLRKSDMVGRFIDGFHSRFSTREEQNEALFRFQYECLDNHTALSRLNEKYRVKARNNEASSSGRTSRSATAAAAAATGGAPSSSGVTSRSKNSLTNPNLIPITSASTYYPPSGGPHRDVQNAVAAAYVSHASSSSHDAFRNPSAPGSSSSTTINSSNYMQNGNMGQFSAASNASNHPSPYYRPPLPHRPPRHIQTFATRASANPMSGGMPPMPNGGPLQYRSIVQPTSASQWRPIYTPGTGPPNAASMYAPQYPSLGTSFVQVRDEGFNNSPYAASSSTMQQQQPAMSYSTLSSAVQKQVYSTYMEAEAALRQYKFRMDSVSFPQTNPMPPPPNFISMNKDLPRIWYARVKHHLRMPFYRNVELLVPPVRLHNIMSVKSAAYLMGTLRFMHSPDRLVLNNNSSSSKTDLMIRFFKIDENEPQLDTLPPNVTIEVRSSGNYASSPPLTLYRTTLVRFKKAKPKHEKPIIIPNDFAIRERSIDVIITYTPSESDYEFAVGIFRAQTVSIEEEVASIRQQPLDASASKQSIIRELRPDLNGDDDISAAEVSSLPLKCPISKSRIRVPCRAMQCTVHHTCDAYSFVEMNFERPTWRCFLCNKDVHLHDLRFETFIDSLLKNYGTETLVGKSDVVNFVLNEKGDDLMIKQDLSSDSAGTALPAAAGGKAATTTVSTSSSNAAATSSSAAAVAAPSKKAAATDVICLSSDDEDKMKNEEADMDISPSSSPKKSKSDETSKNNNGTSLHNHSVGATHHDSSSSDSSSDDSDDTHDDDDAASNSSSDVDVDANLSSSHHGSTPSSLASTHKRKSSRLNSHNSNRATGKRHRGHDSSPTNAAASSSRRHRLQQIRRLKKAHRDVRGAAGTISSFFSGRSGSSATAPPLVPKKPLHSTVGPNGEEVIDLTFSSDEEAAPAQSSSSSRVASSTAKNAAPQLTAATSSQQQQPPSSSAATSVAHTSSTIPTTPTTPGPSMLSANVLVADAVVDSLLAVMNRGMADRMPQQRSAAAAAAPVASSSSSYQQYVAARNAASNMPQSFPTLMDGGGGINYSNNSSPYNAFMSPYVPMVVSPAPPPSVSPLSSSSQGGRGMHSIMPIMPSSNNSPPRMPLLPPPPPPMQLMSFEWRQPAVTVQSQEQTYGPPRYVRQQGPNTSQSATASSSMHISSSLQFVPGDVPGASNIVNISLPSYNGTPMSTPAHSHQNSPGLHQSQLPQRTPSYSLQSVHFDSNYQPSSSSSTYMSDTDALAAAAAASLTPTPNNERVDMVHSSSSSVDSNAVGPLIDVTPKVRSVPNFIGNHQEDSGSTDYYDELMRGVEEIDDSIVTAMFGNYDSAGDRDAALTSDAPSKSSKTAANAGNNSAVAADSVPLSIPATSNSTSLSKDQTLAVDAATKQQQKQASERDRSASQERPGSRLTFRLTSSAAASSAAAAAAKPAAVEVRRPPSFAKVLTFSSNTAGPRTSTSSPGDGSRTSGSSNATTSSDPVARASSATIAKVSSPSKLRTIITEGAKSAGPPHVPPLTIRLPTLSSSSATTTATSSAAARKPVAVSSRLPWTDDDDEDSDNTARGSQKSDDSDNGFAGRRRRDRRRVPPLAINLRSAPLQNRIAATNSSKTVVVTNNNNKRDVAKNDAGSRSKTATADDRKSSNATTSAASSRAARAQTKVPRSVSHWWEKESDDGGRSDDEQFENLNEMLEDFGDEQDDNVLQPAFPKLIVKHVPRNEDAASEEEERNDDEAASRSSSETPRSSNKRRRRVSIASEEESQSEEQERTRSRRSNISSRSPNAKKRSGKQRLSSPNEEYSDADGGDSPPPYQRVAYSAKYGDFDADLIAESSSEGEDEASKSSRVSNNSNVSNEKPVRKEKNTLSRSATKTTTKTAASVAKPSSRTSRKANNNTEDSDPDFDPVSSQGDNQESVWISKRKPAVTAAAAAKRRPVRIVVDDTDDDDDGDDDNDGPSRQKPTNEASSDEGENVAIFKRKPAAKSSHKPTNSSRAVQSTKSKRKNDDDDDDDSMQLVSDDEELVKAAAADRNTPESDAADSDGSDLSKHARKIRQNKQRNESHVNAVKVKKFKRYKEEHKKKKLGATDSEDEHANLSSKSKRSADDWQLSMSEVSGNEEEDEAGDDDSLKEFIASDTEGVEEAADGDDGDDSDV